MPKLLLRTVSLLIVVCLLFSGSSSFASPSPAPAPQPSTLATVFEQEALVNTATQHRLPIGMLAKVLLGKKVRQAAQAFGLVEDPDKRKFTQQWMNLGLTSPEAQVLYDLLKAGGVELDLVSTLCKGWKLNFLTYQEALQGLRKLGLVIQMNSPEGKPRWVANRPLLEGLQSEWKTVTLLIRGARKKGWRAIRELLAYAITRPVEAFELALVSKYVTQDERYELQIVVPPVMTSRELLELNIEDFRNISALNLHALFEKVPEKYLRQVRGWLREYPEQKQSLEEALEAARIRRKEVSNAPGRAERPRASEGFSTPRLLRITVMSAALVLLVPFGREEKLVMVGIGLVTAYTVLREQIGHWEGVFRKSLVFAAMAVSAFMIHSVIDFTVTWLIGNLFFAVFTVGELVRAARVMDRPQKRNTLSFRYTAAAIGLSSLNASLLWEGFRIALLTRSTSGIHIAMGIPLLSLIFTLIPTRLGLSLFRSSLREMRAAA